MMTKEEYKSEIVRMWDSLRDEHKGEYSCYGVDCEFCPLGRRCDRIFSFEMIEVVEKWSKEHPPKKYQVSRLEYDILKIYVEREFYGHFAEYGLLMALLKKGYFKYADGKMDVKNYIRNCEVKEDV